VSAVGILTDIHSARVQMFGGKTYKEHVMSMYNKIHAQNIRKFIYDVFVP
jgi:hypothetical protein